MQGGPPRGFNSPWEASGTRRGQLLWHPLRLNSSVEILGYDATEQIQQIHKLRLAVSLLFVCFTCSQRYEPSLQQPHANEKGLPHSA